MHDVGSNIEEGLENIRFVNGSAKFQNAHKVLVVTPEGKNEIFGAKWIVVACGVRAMIPDFPGSSYGISCEQIFTVRQKPKKVLIVGSGCKFQLFSLKK